MSCEVVLQVCMRCVFTDILQSMQKKPLGISAVSLRYLICHSVCFSSTLLRFGGFNGCRKWGSWPRGVRRCGLTGVVKMLCGSCWKGTELGGWNVNGGERKGRRCLGRLDGEALETLVWCSAVRGASDKVRPEQIQQVGLQSYRTVSFVPHHLHSPKGSLSKQEPGEDINKARLMSHLEDDMTHNAEVQSVPYARGRSSWGKPQDLHFQQLFSILQWML